VVYNNTWMMSGALAKSSEHTDSESKTYPATCKELNIFTELTIAEQVQINEPAL
jgi:hypothetical protein